MKTILTSTLILLASIVNSQINNFEFSIHFKTGEHSLSSDATLALNRIAGHIKTNEIDTVILFGHTDPWGNNAYNDSLSQRRVNSVHSYLQHFKLDCHYKLSHFGEKKLLVKKNNDRADSLNRRVEVFYLNKAQELAKENQYLYGIKKKDPGSIIYEFDPNTRIDTTIFFENLDKTCLDTAANKTHVLIMDWTRSVYAYGTSMLGWYLRNKDQSNFEHIVLFNDGDKKATHRKRMGKTGGIYSGRIDSLTNILHLMEKVAKKGTGGDYPENVVEALLYAQDEFPEADTLVLLADNEACLRDYRLTHKLYKPVKIILNQVSPIDKIVNYQLFGVAAHTNGSVYVNREEYHSLSFNSKDGPKPIRKKDTLIFLAKHPDLHYKEAIIAHQEAKKRIKIIDERPVLSVGKVIYNGQAKRIGQGEYTIGAMSCSGLDYRLYSHVRFKERYTKKQIFQRELAKAWGAVCSPFKKKKKVRRSSGRRSSGSSRSSGQIKERVQ